MPETAERPVLPQTGRPNTHNHPEGGITTSTIPPRADIPAALAALGDDQLRKLSRTLDAAIRDPDAPHDQVAELIYPAAAARVMLRRRAAARKAATARAALVEVMGR